MKSQQRRFFESCRLEQFGNPGGNPPGFPSGNGTGNGWEEIGNLDNGILAEAYLQNTSTLAADGLIDLGNAFSIGGTQDLVFRYRTTGGAFVDAAVQYITSAAVAGDYNNNGRVDAADYVFWRNNRGPGSLAQRGRHQSGGGRRSGLQLLAIEIRCDSLAADRGDGRQRRAGTGHAFALSVARQSSA